MGRKGLLMRYTSHLQIIIPTLLQGSICRLGRILRTSKRTPSHATDTHIVSEDFCWPDQLTRE